MRLFPLFSHQKVDINFIDNLNVH